MSSGGLTIQNLDVYNMYEGKLRTSMVLILLTESLNILTKSAMQLFSSFHTLFSNFLQWLEWPEESGKMV